eukprot:SAG25_NODE_222_length_11605_cov_6.982357_10_plen_57_part_00
MKNGPIQQYLEMIKNLVPRVFSEDSQVGLERNKSLLYMLIKSLCVHCTTRTLVACP